MLTPKPAIELLAPAGSPEALDAAVAEGADAIYLGLQNFNARMRSANFTYSQFESALRSLRRMGKKLYVTVNTVFEQREADRMYQLLKYLAGTDPDAIIVQDYGVIAMARAEFPSLKLHASTQMNIASSRGANQLSKYGLSRIILARELCLEELRSIRSETNAELEVFTHGALCVSASGICLFSSFLGGKSANRGMCTQACRRLYNCDTAGADGDSSGYFFSPGDLQLLERLPQLAAAGIDAIKIEGRMKSASYVGVAVSAYRMVLDAIAETNSSYNNDSEAAGGAVGKAPSEKIAESIRRGREILMGDFAREKTQFYFDGVGAKPELWLNPGQDGGTGIPLGEILKIKGSGGESRALFCPENGAAPAAGDSLRIHRRDDSERLPYKLAFSEPAAGGGFWVSVPPGFYPGDRAYLIQTKGASKRYAPVIARGAKGRHPGMDRSPLPQVNFKGGRGNKGRKGSGSATFPQGLYVAASRAEDLYIVQSARPVRVILSLSQKNMKRLLSATPPLPFKPQDIILSLPVYFPQETALALAPGIAALVEMGYRQFELNNPGQFSLLRGHDVSILAGPWLYAFNAWSLSFVSSLGADAFVSPLENNRQNLERTLEAAAGPGSRAGGKLRERVFITVFARPALFNIRADLGQMYDFKTFSDNRGEVFLLDAGREGSFVYPEKPFSIIDKIPFLKEAGFGRFIIDLSGISPKKSDYRDLMRSIEEARPLSGVSRFNWKDGFFQQDESAEKS